MYVDGQGSMLVKALSLFSVVDAQGVEIDQGAMMRYLSEMVWFPSAFLLGNVSFEAVDEGSARVTLTDQGRTASGTLTVDPDGRLTGFVAERYRMVGGEPRARDVVDASDRVRRAGWASGSRSAARPSGGSPTAISSTSTSGSTSLSTTSGQPSMVRHPMEVRNDDSCQRSGLKRPPRRPHR